MCLHVARSGFASRILKLSHPSPFYKFLLALKFDATFIVSMSIKLNYKLFNVWKKRKLRTPDCMVNHSDKTLSVEETNAFYLGLKHHILPKETDTLKLKSTVESSTSKVLKAH